MSKRAEESAQRGRGLERTEEERRLIEDAERIFPTGTRCLTFDPELNFCAERAEGRHIWDASGTRSIDYLLGSGPHILGHAHPAVVAALRVARRRDDGRPVVALLADSWDRYWTEDWLEP